MSINIEEMNFDIEYEIIEIIFMSPLSDSIDLDRRCSIPVIDLWSFENVLNQIIDCCSSKKITVSVCFHNEFTSRDNLCFC